jgi:hypothetical protein
MKTTKTISDLLLRVKKLEDVVFGQSKATSSSQPHIAKERPSSITLDYSMPMRPFVKRHGVDMGGPKKFTLLLAYLAKGDLKKTIQFVEIKKHWNKMTAKSLLGMEFNTFYPASAKENDWVNSEKNGSYNLRPSWKAIFS